MDKYEKRRAAYKIIPPDYLHMIDGEDHFTLLSAEEVEFIVKYGIENDFDEDEALDDEELTEEEIERSRERLRERSSQRLRAGKNKSRL